MPQPAPLRHRRALLTAFFAGVLAALTLAVPANATPNDEGGTPELRRALESASKGYLDAQVKLANAKKRQLELTDHLKSLEAELRRRSVALGEIAGAAYQHGRLGPVTALLNADSPEGFLDRATALESVAANQDRALRALTDTQEQEARTNAALNREIREQTKQVAVMAARKKQAETALAKANSGGPSPGVTGSGGGTATPARRNPDGSWPSESCSVNDPTTSGCITPRTLHALQQAKAAGFTHYVSCYRSGGSGEHPKGRACDFAAAQNGFEGVASGSERTYGNNLAAYFIRNASRLAVLYVIWFRQIWLPSSGWKAYSGGGGDPSSDHTNHVHLSVY
jgi:peptidoglycan DL-endopeptidase CwlO